VGVRGVREADGSKPGTAASGRRGGRSGNCTKPRLAVDAARFGESTAEPAAVDAPSSTAQGAENRGPAVDAARVSEAKKGGENRGGHGGNRG